MDQVTPMELCELEIHRATDAVVFSLLGEIDASNAPDLEQRLQQEELAPRIVVDLSAVSYLDSSGLRLIHLLQRDASAASHVLIVVAPEGSAPRRLLEITGLGDDLVVAGERPELA